MMETICFLAGVALIACGLAVACATARRRSARRRRAKNAPPPLPPRVEGSIPPSVSRARTPGDSSAERPIPPRRTSASAAAGANREGGTEYGPRGVRPDQFPCCPYDKQRNIPGQKQLIFWDSGANCYRCSRGHQFKSNGKLMQ